MTRRRHIPRIESEADARSLRNLQYLENLKKRNQERNQEMGRIIDPLGIPMGGNAQPQPQQVNFNPIFAMLLPSFYQTIQTITGADEMLSAAQVVDKAWEIANLAFEKMGFRFVFPMGAEIQTPNPKLLKPETPEPKGESNV